MEIWHKTNIWIKALFWDLLKHEIRDKQISNSVGIYSSFNIRV